MNNKGFIIDKTHFPVIIIKALDGVPNREDWDRYKKEYEALFNDYTQFYILFDTSCLFGLPLTWVYEKAGLLQKLKPLTEEKLIGSAIIVTNSVIKGMLNMLLTVYPTVRPNKLVINEQEGLEFLNSIKKD